MTELLEQALERARSLSPEMQDDIARLMLTYAGDGRPVIPLTADEEADLAEAERRDFATDEQMRAIWAKHRL